MLRYIIKRILLIFPTLIGIMLINFAIIQFTPGGPVDQLIADLRGYGGLATDRIVGNGGDIIAGGASTKDERLKGLDSEIIQQIEARFGFDKPAHLRFIDMMGQYLLFDFGTSFFVDKKISTLIIEKLPVSISLGVWSTLLIYLISIPLGIAKAVRHGSQFDLLTSAAIIVGYAIPGFLFAVLLIVLFAGGRYFDWFPLRGIVSDNWRDLSLMQQIIDYFWHLTLPIISLVIGGFATLTMLTKNSFLDEVQKQYVLTARAKGLSEMAVLTKHVFRNAMLIIIAGFPSAFIGMLFTGALLVEIIFSLDGLGLLGFEAVIKRDYPIFFATLYFFTLLGLILNLLNDIIYSLVDPRINFDSQDRR